METVRSVLDWASSIEGQGYDLAPACRAVRDKLGIRDVLRVVQDFVGSLLYVVIAAEAKNSHGKDVNAKDQLTDFLYQLCGLHEQSESSSSSTRVCAALVEPCKSCACCHIALREALNILRFVHHFTSTESAASSSETVSEQHLPRHSQHSQIRRSRAGRFNLRGCAQERATQASPTPLPTRNAPPMMLMMLAKGASIISIMGLVSPI